MREISGDLWEEEADAKVITTNAATNSRGHAVMGRGVALQCKERYPGIEAIYGRWLDCNTARVTCMLSSDPVPIPLVFFLVKYHWRERASIPLILQSLGQLIELTDTEGWNKIVMPRPGCGNGGLDWHDVGPILRASLDNRFYVVERQGLVE